MESPGRSSASARQFHISKHPRLRPPPRAFPVLKVSALSLFSTRCVYVRLRGVSTAARTIICHLFSVIRRGCLRRPRWGTFLELRTCRRFCRRESQLLTQCRLRWMRRPTPGGSKWRGWRCKCRRLPRDSVGDLPLAETRSEFLYKLPHSVPDLKIGGSSSAESALAIGKKCTNNWSRSSGICRGLS